MNQSHFAGPESAVILCTYMVVQVHCTSRAGFKDGSMHTPISKYAHIFLQRGCHITNRVFKQSKLAHSAFHRVATRDLHNP